MVRWCCPHRRTRFDERGVAAVGPVDDVVGVAHHRGSGAAGEGAVGVPAHQGPPQGGGDQALGAADVEDLAVGAEGDRDQVGVAGQPADHGGGEVEAVVGGGDRGAEGGPVDLAAEHVQAGGDREAGSGAVAVRCQVGGQHVLTGGDQGVPHPGPVVPRIGHLLAVRVHGIHGGVQGGGGLGQREQGGLDGGGVLEGAAAAEPDPAGAVVGDGEEPVVVRGPVGAVEVLLGVAFGLVGVGDLGQVPGGLGQLGRRQLRGLVEQERLALLPHRSVQGQLLDGGHDHRRLLRGDPPGRQRGVRRGPLTDQDRAPAAPSGAPRGGWCRPGG